MTFNDYQLAVMRTANNDVKAQTSKLLNASLGLNGESGEFADAVKKCVYQGHELDRDHLIEELGDVMWYVAYACAALDYDLGEVVEANVEKLRRRYPEGFEAERSKHRVTGGE